MRRFFQKRKPRPVETLPFPLQFSLSLPGDRLVEGEAVICYVFAPLKAGQHRIGTRIVNISPRHTRILEQCVVEIDRQQSHLR